MSRGCGCSKEWDHQCPLETANMDLWKTSTHEGFSGISSTTFLSSNGGKVACRDFGFKKLLIIIIFEMLEILFYDIIVTELQLILSLQHAK